MSKIYLGDWVALLKISLFMPQDDPNTKIFQLQTSINDLEKQEKEIYVQMAKSLPQPLPTTGIQ